MPTSSYPPSMGTSSSTYKTTLWVIRRIGVGGRGGFEIMLEITLEIMLEVALEIMLEITLETTLGHSKDTPWNA